MSQRWTSVTSSLTSVVRRLSIDYTNICVCICCVFSCTVVVVLFCFFLQNIPYNLMETEKNNVKKMFYGAILLTRGTRQPSLLLLRASHPPKQFWQKRRRFQDSTKHSQGRAIYTRNTRDAANTKGRHTQGRAGKTEAPDQKSRGKIRGRKCQVKHDKQRAAIKIS